MKLKNLLAVVGAIIYVGAMGNADYMVEIGANYPMWKTVVLSVFGIALMLPAVLREVL